MKRIISIFALTLLAGLFLFSCKGKTEEIVKAINPEEVVTKALKCMMDKDYEGYVKLVKMSDEAMKSDSKKKKAQDQLLSLIKDKMETEVKEKGGIKDYSVGKAIIDGEKARVPYTITYGNGETAEEEMSMINTEKEGWMIDMGK